MDAKLQSNLTRLAILLFLLGALAGVLVLAFAAG